MVVVGTVIVVNTFAGDVGCCGRGEWWWGPWWSFLMCLRVTWDVVDMASGGGHHSGHFRHVCG